MAISNPVVLASIVLGALGGFFVARMLSSRFLGSCLTITIGLFILGVVVFFLVKGQVAFVGNMTSFLGYYIETDFPAFASFSAGMIIGFASRSRRR